MRRLNINIPMLFLFIIVFAVVVGLSLIAFPDYFQSNPLILVLIGAAAGGVAEFLANFRTLIQKPSSPLALRGEAGGGPPPTTQHTIAGSGKFVTFDQRSQAVEKQIIVTGDYIAATPAFTPLHQLRPAVADFTGRDDEINRLVDALQPGRAAAISSIDGMPGVGKTELAYAAAGRLTHTFPDAQLVIDMRGTSDQPLAPLDAMLAVVRAFQPQTPPLDDEAEAERQYRAALHNKRAFILLDNARDAAQVRRLTPPVTCALLVTSRKRIELPGIARIDLDILPPDRARELITTVSKRALTPAQADRIAELCGRLPLALRIAGTLLSVRDDWPTSEFITALTGERTRLARLKHEDLDIEAALSLSHAQLQRDDSTLARRWLALSVFPASFHWQAARSVWELPQDDTTTARDSLSRLVERSLLIHDPALGRYRLHDLVRLFAGAQMSDADRLTAQRRHAQYFVEILAQADNLYLKGGDSILAGLALFDREWANIQAGHAWAESNNSTDDEAAALCTRYPDVGAYCLNLRQHPHEQIHWSEVSVSAARRLGDRRGEGAALGKLGNAYYALGDARRAIEFYEQRLAIAREISAASRSEAERTAARRGEGATLGNLGLAYAALGDARRAIEFYEQHLAIAREISAASRSEAERTAARRGEGITLGNLGNAYAALGDARRAIEFYEQHLAIAREIGDRRGEGAALGNLGIAYKNLGDARRAIEFYEQHLAIAREIGDRRGEGQALGNLGLAYADLGDARRAIEFYEQRLVIAREIGDRRGEALASWNLGLAYAKEGNLASAVAAMQLCVDFEREIGHPDADKDATQVEQLRARLREST